ncbi:MAG: tetratricopeptide repeat protein [Verrucomicrobia bacterium]|nr:tetratricopeptide repeat protein [Verrucomicrobiota bacterium]
MSALPFRWARLALVVLLGSCWSASVRAASPVENRAFDAAARSFNDGFYSRAEREWGDFVRQFPNADRLAQAVLYQAQARFHLGKYDAVVDLLNGRLAQAGKLADQYWYWIAEAQLQRGQTAAAAVAYARVARDFPQSPLRLRAAYGEAIAWFKAGDPAKALERLRQPDGAFQQSARTQPHAEFVGRGELLAAEVMFEQKDNAGAAEGLRRLDRARLPAELRWKADYLTIQLQLANRQLEPAFEGATNLMAWTVSNGLRTLQEQTVALQGDILQKLGQPDAAIRTYTNNLAADVPPERQRQALLKIIELSLIQDRGTQAIEWLETFVRERPKDPNLDLIRLTLGEVQFKAAAALRGTNAPASVAPPAATNWLAHALDQFDEVIKNYAQSPLVGKAWLDRGWCLWEEGRFAESAPAFQEAAERLPVSEDQAVARFKWADAQFQSGDFGGAVTHYQQVLDYTGAVPSLPSTFFEQALYQLARAGIRSGNLAAATNALTQILARYPDSYFCDDSLLLVGQDLNRRGKPAEARAVFADFLKRYPQSPLAPEAQLAVARTYVREGDLGRAIQQYDSWVGRFTNNPALALVEFDRAWLTYEAGRQSNAVNLLTHFVTRFPTNTNDPLALYLVGNYYFDQGDFANAELNYRLLSQNTNWPVSDLTFEALLMAGRTAFARGAFEDARRYFLSVINDLHTPPDLLAEAYFYLGDTTVEAPARDAAHATEKYKEAISSYSKIPLTNHLAPRALGRKADCYLQLSDYDRAAEFYTEAMRSSLADVATRSQAEVGLGLVAEKQAPGRPAAEQSQLLGRALDHYLNVLYGTNLRDGEKADPYWLGQAGLAAGRLLERQEKWDLAAKVYARLLDLPPLRRAAESKIAALQTHLDQDKK